MAKVYYSYKRKSTIEKLEDIEILRFFDLNKKIKMIKITSGNIAVDEKSDIKKIEKFLKKKKNEKKIYRSTN